MAPSLSRGVIRQVTTGTVASGETMPNGEERLTPITGLAHASQRNTIYVADLMSHGSSFL